MIAIALITLALVLAPFKGAIPDVPDDAIWSPLLYVLVLLGAAASLLVKDKSSLTMPRAVAAPIVLMGIFVALSLTSMVYHWLIVSHGRPVFMDAMLRQLGAYLALTALAAALCRAATERLNAYIVIAGLLAAATVASGYGLADYLSYAIVFHQPEHREFATSTPDYFACFLVTTIPVTLALLIGSFRNATKVGSMVYGCSLLLQLMVLASTGSRFAVIALFAGLVSLGIGLWIAARTGGAAPKLDRRLAVVLAVILLLGCAVGSRTVLHRLVGPAAKAQNNSIMFRWWTWKGSERTALSNPVLGTGPGTFPYAYQRWAYVGMTRNAHNSYFEATTDTGFAAGIILTIGLIWVYSSGFRSISRWSVVPPVEAVAEQPPRRGKRTPIAMAPKMPDVKSALQGEDAGSPPGSVPLPLRAHHHVGERRIGKAASDSISSLFPGRKGNPRFAGKVGLSEQFLAAFAAVDERIVIAGLAASFVAGLVHNLFDSDWYVTFNALTLWGIGGVLLAYARRAHSGPPVDKLPAQSVARQTAAVMTAAVYVVAGIGFVCFAVAQSDAEQAASATNGTEAVGDYQAAISINPTRGGYYSELGFNVYQAMGDLPSAESALKHAIAIEPNATNYRRLGKLYLRESRPADALRMFSAGLDAEWNDLDLYLLSAQAQTALGNTEGALDNYRMLAAYQQEKIGRYPALGDYVEIRYAQADVPLGDDALAHGSVVTAIKYYRSALPLLRRYAEEDGTMGGRAAFTGGRPDPDADKQIYALFQDDIKGLAQAYTAVGSKTDAAEVTSSNAGAAREFASIIERETKVRE